MPEPLKLYVVPASHPCIAVMAALDLKGLEYERVDLFFGVSNVHQLARFRGRTVPGLTIGERKVHGSRKIFRALDEVAPDPPLVPADPDARAAVDAADEWGDRVLQEHARWISLTAVSNSPDVFPGFLEGYAVPRPPLWAIRSTAKAGVQFEGRLLGHTRGRVLNEYLLSLPTTLDEADRLIADGVIGGEQPNAADFQIGSSVRLLMNLEDLRPGIEPRPCGALARRLFPDYPGHVPAGSLPSPLSSPVP